MRNSTALIAALAIGLGAMAGIARGQEDVEHRRFDAQEHAFLRQAMDHDLFMWRLGEYAERHAAAASVKDLGKDVARESRDDLRDIQHFAEDHRANLEQPKDITLQEKSLMDRMSQKPGIDFDKDYTKLLVEQYDQLIHQYERERDHAADPALREYAAQRLPKLQSRMDKAKEAQHEVWR